MSEKIDELIDLFTEILMELRERPPEKKRKVYTKPKIYMRGKKLTRKDAAEIWSSGASNRDRKSTRLNSSHSQQSRMPSSA